MCNLWICPQLLRSSLVNNRTQAKVAEELGMQEFAITNDKTKRPVALRTKTLADLLECMFTALSFAELQNEKRKNLYRPFIDHNSAFFCMSRMCTLRWQHEVPLLISLFPLCCMSNIVTSLLKTLRDVLSMRRVISDVLFFFFFQIPPATISHN